MVKLTIDGRDVEVEEGGTVLDAAVKLGISVPTMCYLRECGPLTSCMVCAVLDVNGGRIIPACSARAVEGMMVDTACDKVMDHRRVALELLLSEHAGDCEGPCRRGCPAWMDIPEMIRQIAGNDLRKAIEVIKQDIPLPAVLGRICPAPCERVCRRAEVDEAVGICLLKRHAADADLASGSVYLPACAADTGKRVAITGGGPAGLSAAYFLRRQGHAVKVFEKEDRAGGALRGAWAEKGDLQAVLDAEINVIVKMGVELITGCEAEVDRLAGEFDAVIDASGYRAAKEAVRVHPHTFETERKGMFAVGGAVRQLKMSVMAVAHGHGAACSVDQFLNGKEIEGMVHGFDSRRRWKEKTADCRLQTEDRRQGDGGPVLRSSELCRASRRAEVPCFALLSYAGQAGGRKTEEAKVSGIRYQVSGLDFDAKYTKGGVSDALPHEAAERESKRCMDCDCIRKDDCRLRDYSGIYGAKQSRFPSLQADFEVDVSHPEIVYEPGKCIKCGLCVEVSRRREGGGGVGFVNRGIETRVVAPLGQQIVEALKISGEECAEKCPTGAISKRRL